VRIEPIPAIALGPAGKVCGAAGEKAGAGDFSSLRIRKPLRSTCFNSRAHMSALIEFEPAPGLGTVTDPTAVHNPSPDPCTWCLVGFLVMW
jgi:hypothetical protein